RPGEPRARRGLAGTPPPAVAADALSRRITRSVERGTESLVPAPHIAVLVPAAEVVDLEAMLARAPEPRQQVVDRAAGEESLSAAAHPPPCAPGEPRELDPRVPRAPRPPRPASVSGAAWARAGPGAVPAPRPGGGFCPPPALDFEDLHARTDPVLEEGTQDLPPRRPRVAEEPPAFPPPAADRPHT